MTTAVRPTDAGQGTEDERKSNNFRKELEEKERQTSSKKDSKLAIAGSTSGIPLKKAKIESGNLDADDPIDNSDADASAGSANIKFKIPKKQFLLPEFRDQSARDKLEDEASFALNTGSVAAVERFEQNVKRQLRKERKQGKAAFLAGLGPSKKEDRKMRKSIKAKVNQLKASVSSK